MKENELEYPIIIIEDKPYENMGYWDVRIGDTFINDYGKVEVAKVEYKSPRLLVNPIETNKKLLKMLKKVLTLIKITL